MIFFLKYKRIALLFKENDISKQIYEIKKLEENYHKKQEELNKIFILEEIENGFKNKNNQEEYQKSKGII